jgi:hypothetical protein
MIAFHAGSYLAGITALQAEVAILKAHLHPVMASLCEIVFSGGEQPASFCYFNHKNNVYYVIGISA